MGDAKYLSLVHHYERCLREHGPTHKGVDWPNQTDLDTRYRVMLELCTHDDGASLLDLGCGYGGLLGFMLRQDIGDRLTYAGIDISGAMIAQARQLHPGHAFEVRDIIADPLPVGSVDYVIMNGVLTEKQSLSHDEMLGYVRELLDAVYGACRKAFAFNVMNKDIVEWERQDLFYLSPADVHELLHPSKAARIETATNYGLYEFTAYVHKG